MKHIVVVAAFLLGSLHVVAQANDTKNSRSKKTGQSQNKTTKKSAKPAKKQLPPGTAIRGGKVVTLHNGAHNYTPGSPVGTGGAGGSSMSGSPQGSASENALGRKPSNELLKKNGKIQSKTSGNTTKKSE